MKNEEIIDKLNAIGVPMYKQQLTKIFKRTFYCGVINHGLLDGKLVEGTHEPLVSKEVFLRCNEIHQQSAGYGVPHKKEDDHIPLKVFMKCVDCGEPMTGYIVRTKNLYYYKCRKKGCHNNRNADRMHELFEELLSCFIVRKEYISSIIYSLEHAYHESTKEQREQESILKTQLAEVEKDLATIKRNFLVKELMDQATYQELYHPCEKQRTNIIQQLNKIVRTISNPSELIAGVVRLCAKLNTVWASGSAALKEDLQRLIFPQGILYDKENRVFRTPEVNNVFWEIARQTGGKGDNEKGTNRHFDGLSLAAEKAGLTSLAIADLADPQRGRPDQIDACSLRELLFLFLRFCRSKLRNTPKQKCPRQSRGTSISSAGRRGQVSNFFIRDLLKINEFRNLF